MDLIEYMLLDVAARPREQIREAIRGLYEQIRSMPFRGTAEDCPVQHVFAPGTYSREITMPEGMLIGGRIHRYDHINIISKGKLRVLTEFGSETIEAPCIFVSRAGTQRVGYILEDTVWTTVHANPTNETDIAKIEREHLIDSHDEIEIQGELV